MNDDRLLQKIAEHARHRGADRPDPRWDALAAGELSDEDRQALVDEDPDGERKAQAFDPLPAEFRDAIKRDLRTSLATSTAPTAAPGKRRSRWIGALAASLVAALAVVVLLPRSDGFAPLPGYTSTLRGGAVMRSENDGPAVLRNGERIELILTPATGIETPLATGGFVLVDERIEPVTLPQTQFSPFGAARIVAVVGEDLALPAGDSVLLVAVSHPGAQPDRSEVAKRLAEPVPEATPWQLLTFPLRLEAP